jgi:ketosteroid isomerase-like protein
LNIILITLVTALAASVHAQSEADAAAQSKIVALEQLWNQAYKSGDTKALDSNTDDAIVLVNDDSSVQTRRSFWPASSRPCRSPMRSDRR